MVFKERLFFGETPEDDAPQPVANLETRVADTMATVAGLDASDVAVTSRGNTIVLTGYVQTPEEIDRATDAALSVEGVADVDNQLIVPDMRPPNL